MKKELILQPIKTLLLYNLRNIIFILNKCHIYDIYFFNHNLVSL